MNNINTGKDFLKFFQTKGDYLVELSENHFKNKEYMKALELLNKAYSMYMKCKNTDDAERTKQRFQEIKNNFLK
ncbi:MAG: hypothetical protein ACTSV5_02540 [Promethearchaeota archaeon]